MPNPPLHELDLASITVLPDDMQRAEIRKLGKVPPPYTLNHVRNQMPAIFNVRGGMLDVFCELERATIETALRGLCKDERELEANLRIARSLMDFASLYRLIGRYEEFPGVVLRSGWRPDYAFNFLVDVEGTPTAFAMNPRRRHLSPAARIVLFSLMHEQVRTISPEHAGIALRLLEFKKAPGRAVRLVEANERALLPATRLEEMIQTTYRIRAEVLEERAAERRAGRAKPRSSGSGLF